MSSVGGMLLSSIRSMQLSSIRGMQLSSIRDMQLSNIRGMWLSSIRRMQLSCVGGRQIILRGLQHFGMQQAILAYSFGLYTRGTRYIRSSFDFNYIISYIWEFSLLDFTYCSFKIQGGV